MDNKPSVVQVAISLAPGGTERLIIETVKRLKSSFRMAVCCLDAEGEWSTELRDEGIDVTTLGRTPGFHPGLAAKIGDYIDRTGASVIHCHQYSPFVYGRLATAFRRNVRVVYTEHGRLSDAPPSLKRRMVNPMLQARGLSVCAVSEDLKNYMVRAGFRRETIRVVYNGIDVRTPARRNGRSRLAALGVPEGALVAGTVARLDPVKSLDTFIAALALAHRSTALAPHGVIVGAGSERAALEAFAAERGVAPFVHFAGHREDARAWLPEFDLFVNSSISEGVSLTILEAMAAALPIVATAVGGTPEVVVDGATGVLVPSRDPERLSRAMNALLADYTRRRDIGDAARSRVETLFTLDRMVSDYARMYAGEIN